MTNQTWPDALSHPEVTIYAQLAHQNEVVGPMPEVSRFFGIIIRMFTETGEQHHVPHVHAYYQNDKATFRIDNGKLLAGYLPRRQHRLVEEWIELYQAELLENWSQADAGDPIDPVPPLKR